VRSGIVIATLIGHKDDARVACFSADGSRVVTASADNTARIWDAASGKLIATLVHNSSVQNAQFSPDGSCIITVAGNGAWIRNILPSNGGAPPAWFPDFLRYMAQVRLNSDGELETLKLKDWLGLRERIRTLRKSTAGQGTPYLNVLRRCVKYPDERETAIRANPEILARSRELTSMEALAQSFAALDRKEDAVKTREDILVLTRKVFGAEQPETIHALIKLESSYHTANHPDKVLQTREEILALRRKINGPKHADTLRVKQSLISLYRAAGVWDKALPLMEESFVDRPDDTFLAQYVSTLQAWFGKNADHVATCRRVMALAVGTDDPSVADRAAKAYCLLPSSDPQLLETALALARRAVELGKNHQYWPYYQMALGMAEYRHGNYGAADAALAAAEQAENAHRHVREAAPFFRAMSLFRQGKAPEARKLFTEAQARMKPLPADERQPFANNAVADDVIIWLAYKEAKMLLIQE
jgi:tetratricopeptide (TPR) repeat protein